MTTTDLVQVFAPVDEESYRRTAGSFCTGVTIITTYNEGRPSGFSCQSFTSLSLQPPLVLFCVSGASTTWPKIRDEGSFCVNVLASEQQELGRRFARSGISRFEGVPWIPAPGGMPVILGAAAWITCTVQSEQWAGDHCIVVGRVTHVGTDPDKQPLLYFRGELGYQP